MRPLVSIIMPSLNVEKYIKECIDSVRNQTLENIEIICVDAGSDDGTLEIIQEEINEDNRIRLIRSEKKSYGYQMNIGIDESRGEYIGIVETDDYVMPEMFGDLYTVAKKNSLDFIKSDFWRFTGTGEAIQKKYFNVADNTFYGRVVDTSREKQCFEFVMNIWCGIYNSNFIKKNNIRFYESPGASFQDNGFWFQTYALGKKVWFLNKAYYMNRRDNENSSVFAKDKVYCICNEYDFIMSNMKQRKLFERYKYIYANILYKNYKWTYDKISVSQKKEFLKVFYDRAKVLLEIDALKEQYFTPYAWKTINSILDDWEKYYEYSIGFDEWIYELACQYYSVVIYGAGAYGKKLFNILTNQSVPIRVVSFAVSEASDAYGDWMGIPIRNIADLNKTCKNSLIIVAAKGKYGNEMLQKASTLGFQNLTLISNM